MLAPGASFLFCILRRPSCSNTARNEFFLPLLDSNHSDLGVLFTLLYPTFDFFHFFFLAWLSVVATGHRPFPQGRFTLLRCSWALFLILENPTLPLLLLSLVVRKVSPQDSTPPLLKLPSVLSFVPPRDPKTTSAFLPFGPLFAFFSRSMGLHHFFLLFDFHGRKPIPLPYELRLSPCVPIKPLKEFLRDLHFRLGQSPLDLPSFRLFPAIHGLSHAASLPSAIP